MANKQGIFYVGGPGQIIGRPGGAVRVAGGIVPIRGPRIDTLPMPPTVMPPFVQPKPRRKVKPMPPMRVPPVPQPPAIQPRPVRTRPAHTRGHRYGMNYRHRPRRLGPPVYVPPTERLPQPTPVPMPVMTAPPLPTGKPCPTWGWAVSTNPDGSETVHPCTPGQPMAAGLHGLGDFDLSQLSSSLGTVAGIPIFYLVVAGVAYFLFFKKGR